MTYFFRLGAIVGFFPANGLNGGSYRNRHKSLTPDLTTYLPATHTQDKEIQIWITQLHI